MAPRVFVSAALPGDAVTRLRAAADVHLGGGVGGDVFGAIAGECEAIVSLLTDRVDASVLAQTPKLRVVANVAVGVDNVDLDACRAGGVLVANTPGVLTDATADLAFGLLIDAARRISEGDRLARAQRFPAWTIDTMVGTRVTGATLGIIGFGRIGQAVARRARGFGMKIQYAQRTRLPPELERALCASHATLDEIFTTSDFVSLHCPLTPETRHLVTRARLGSMKPGAILVNTARGACVDEAALADALTNGPLAAAGLDVFEDEPRVHPALAALENVVLAPHIGSADRETREKMAAIAVDAVIEVLAGRSPANLVR